MAYVGIHDSATSRFLSDSYLIILFSMCLQEKKKSNLQNADKKVGEKKTLQIFLCCFSDDLLRLWSAHESKMEPCHNNMRYNSCCTGICGQISVWKKRPLFFLISFKGQFPSLAANCKPGNRIKTVKALEIQFLLVTANQLVSVNGCGHPPCWVPRALLLPANLTSAF